MRLPGAIDVSPTRRAGLGWAVALAVAFALLATIVSARVLAVSDSLLLTIAQSVTSPGIDAAMVAFSLLGSLEVTGLVMAILVARTLVLRGRFTADVLVPVALLLGATIIEVTGKLVIHQPPVPLQLMRGPRFGLGLSTAYSFPSGHMVRATFVYGLVALRLVGTTRSRWWPWLLLVLVWTIGFSRVYLGEHWPTDVAGGILLGGAALGLALAIATGAGSSEEIAT